MSDQEKKWNETVSPFRSNYFAGIVRPSGANGARRRSGEVFANPVRLDLTVTFIAASFPEIKGLHCWKLEVKRKEGTKSEGGKDGCCLHRG